MFKVYKIVNDINDDIYVGSTRNELRKRFFQHKSRSKKYPDMNNLYKFINEVGISHFRIIEIERFEFIDKEYQLKKEQEYIDLYKPLLNKIDAYSYCPHNKVKNYCVDCGGSQICIHQKQKYRCVECSGKGICEHNKVKNYCVDCGGSQICIHQKQKAQCKICKGNNICEHNKRKDYCKICKGSGICEHQKRKSTCKICGGSQICEHNKNKRICKDCKGNNICEHNKNKSCCKICNPVICGFCNKTYSKNTIKRHIKNLHN